MKKRNVTIPTALMLMLLAVVCTFNITFFVATDYYNTRLEELEEPHLPKAVNAFDGNVAIPIG